ncbi:serine hydrolase domain-containing protein [Streptomyces coeruleofuscus]|uniref:Serine hydrolase domain-containing protein n=1 Tax=Streptomyces coeruleofuscus TaxID=66879 RepID=A0ABP5VCL0_9ACTN
MTAPVLLKGRRAAPPDHSQLGLLLRNLAARHHVPGAQLAVLHGADGLTEFAVETGEERFGGGSPVTPGSRFPVGSLTKAFTALLLMTLADDGEVDLDTPVGAQFPELSTLPGGYGSRLLPRHLLSHTSGLPAGHPADSPPGDRGQYLREACAARPVCAPGAAFSYSNVGIVAAGHLAELALGMSWEEALRSVVLGPLGIEAAWVTPGAGLPGPAHVPGHTARPELGKAVPVGQLLAAVEAPAGGLALSARDLLSFGRLFTDHPLRRRGGLLPGPRVTEAMRRSQPHTDAFGLADTWGLGLAGYQAPNGQLWFGHDGTGDGTSCHLRVDPQEGTVVALTTNAGTGLALWEDLVAGLHELGIPVASHPFAEPRGSAPPAPPSLVARCAGTYVNGAVTYDFVQDADGLRLDQSGGPYARIALRTDLAFSVVELTTEKTAYAGRFIQDPGTGRIDGMQISGRLAARDHA